MRANLTYIYICICKPSITYTYMFKSYLLYCFFFLSGFFPNVSFSYSFFFFMEIFPRSRVGGRYKCDQRASTILTKKQNQEAPQSSNTYNFSFIHSSIPKNCDQFPPSLSKPGVRKHEYTLQFHHHVCLPVER